MARQISVQGSKHKHSMFYGIVSIKTGDNLINCMEGGQWIRLVISSTYQAGEVKGIFTVV